MSDQPQDAPPSGGVLPATPLAGRAAAAPGVSGTCAAARGWGSRIVPFVPIVLALATAIAIRQYQFHAPPKTPLEIGDKAPDFSLRDAQKEEGSEPVALSRLVDRGPVVVIFHRGLLCPVCMQHLQELAGQIADFRDAGIQVIAIGPDTRDEAREAIEIYGAFPFLLLSDPDDKTALAYGLEAPEGLILDAVFVVDRERRIRLAEKSNEPVGKASELLAAGKATTSPH
jgi:peroxiredoxin